MVLKIIEKFHSVMEKKCHIKMQIGCKSNENFSSIANCFKTKRNRTKANQNKTILKINEKFNSVKRKDFFHIKMQIG